MLGRIALAFLILTVASAQASTHDTRIPVSGNDAAPEVSQIGIQKGLKLISTTFSSGYRGAPVGASFQPIDKPVRLTCPKKPKGTCVIESQISLQIDYSSAQNAVSACSTVDGYYMDAPVCPTIQYAFQSGITTINAIGRGSDIGIGKHVVRSHVYSSNGVKPLDYTIVYRVYKSR